MWFYGNVDVFTNMCMHAQKYHIQAGIRLNNVSEASECIKNVLKHSTRLLYKVICMRSLYDKPY